MSQWRVLVQIAGWVELVCVGLGIMAHRFESKILKIGPNCTCKYILLFQCNDNEKYISSKSCRQHKTFSCRLSNDKDQVKEAEELSIDADFPIIEETTEKPRCMRAPD